MPAGYRYDEEFLQALEAAMSARRRQAEEIEWLASASDAASTAAQWTGAAPDSRVESP